MEGSEAPKSVESVKAEPKKIVETYRVGEAGVQLGWVETNPKPVKKPKGVENVPGLKSTPETGLDYEGKRDASQEREGVNPSKAVIFMGAWNWDSDLPIMRGISQKMADGFGQRVYQIDSKTDKIGPQSYAIRAGAITQFLAMHNLNEITIVGHSEGGIVAANLVAALERNGPQVKIDGLVLMDSMGIYKRSVLDLAKKFVSDPVNVAGKEFKDSGIAPPEGGAMQLLQGIWRDIRFFGARYPREFFRQLKTMASLNPVLQQIKAPVLIMTAERDYVSDYRSYLPDQEIQKRMEASEPDDQLNIWLEKQTKWEQLPAERQARYGNEANFHLNLVKSYRKHEAVFKRGKARGQYLKENILPEAENTAMIVISKGAHHAGVTDIRIDQAAKVASRMFERMRRKAV